MAGVAPNLLNSYRQQYSVSLEHALTPNTGARISYIGSKGTQVPYPRDANQALQSSPRSPMS